MTPRLPSLLTVAVLLATMQAAAAQPSIRVTAGETVDGWSASGDDSRELRSSLAAAIEQAFANARGRVWAGGEVFTYSSQGDWTSVQIASGASWTFSMAGDRLALHAGGSGMLRRNGDAWTAANVNAVGAFANLEWTPRATASFRVGYAADVRAFDDVASLNHLLQHAFVGGLVNLPSRTTLIGEVTIGAKRYAGLSDADVAWMSFTDAAGVVGAPNVAGAGSGGTNGSANGGGMGAGAGNAATGTVPRPSTMTMAAHQLGLPVVSGAVSARQVTVFGRVAQSLAMRTSLMVDVTRRATFGEVPPAVITTPVELFEDGLYDDPYASDLTDARVTLTHVLARGIDLQASVARLDKPFRQTPAYADDGFYRADGALRHDRVARVQVAASIPLAPTRTGAWDVALLVRADYVRHRSNDAFSSYTSRALTLSTTIGR